MRRPLTLALAVVGIGLTLPTSAAAQDTSGLAPGNATGPCTATASIVDGQTIDPYRFSGVYTVPLSGSATYAGSVPVGDSPRPISGNVEILTPPGIPNISVSDTWTWDNPAAISFESSGSVSWDLPSFIPRGVEITVEGYHSESGVTICEGSVTIEIEGGPFDSPAAPVALGATALGAVGIGFAARAKGPTR